MPPGNTGPNQESSLEIYTMLPAGANPMPLNPVTITLKEPSNPAPLLLTPQNANKNAELDGKILMMMTKLTDNLDTDSTTTKMPSKLNCSPMDPSKLPLPFMEISPLTNPVFTITFLEKLSEDTPSNLWDGESKMELLTGSLLTHGTWTGVTVDTSKLKEELMNVVSLTKLFLDFPNSEFSEFFIRYLL